MTTRNKYLLGAGLVALGATYLLLTRTKNYPPLATVAAVDLNRYAGKWYEIAAFPQRFQKGCHCTTAEYQVNPEGYVEVFNACRKNKPTGKLKSIKGKAFAVPGSNNSKLQVQFFWPFTGDYWVLALAEDYSYAVVGTPDRDNLWILSRTPAMAPTLYARLVQEIAEKGFEVSRLRKTNQSCG
ncbi:membrane protein [Adhaeribacter aerolatus]|uniref:Membrane protein n=1 Tax=Adhaeribacter aerolatus TaxID=670289 RepID=A0A512ATJ5_9BACT|nr:lipocalin family protein [Adhaeribacter aerolatus]GEO03035.1 membrane protein [Adhaeribacter aerolatus]